MTDNRIPHPLNEREQHLLERAMKDAEDARKIADLQEQRARDIVVALAGGRRASYNAGSGVLMVVPDAHLSRAHSDTTDISEAAYAGGESEDAA